MFSDKKLQKHLPYNKLINADNINQTFYLIQKYFKSWLFLIIILFDKKLIQKEECEIFGNNWTL